MWNPSLPDRLGYEKKTTIIRSLKERFQLAISYSPEELRRLLKMNSVSYQLDSEFDILQFVAFLDKPFAELLDELGIPREYTHREFIEFHGPVIPDPNRPYLRRIVPGLIEQPTGVKELAIQPVFKHIVNLPLLFPMKFSIDELSKQVFFYM